MKKKELTSEQVEEIRVKKFIDMICPGTIKFYSSHYICGGTFRSVWAIREYAPTTEEQAILSGLADKNNVTIKIYSRVVTPQEHHQIMQQASRTNNAEISENAVVTKIEAAEKEKELYEMLAAVRDEQEAFLHCAVYIELKAGTLEKLQDLQAEVKMELNRAKIRVDQLLLRQQDGFLCVQPLGYNALGSMFERVMPASAVANLYPFNYSGKSDPHGFYIGRDKYGTNILVDIDSRTSDQTNGNVLILGNPGQGKSYLLKGLITNLRESGKRCIILDAEDEYRDLTNNLGGTYIDLMAGGYKINPLEPKEWQDVDVEVAPDAFKKHGRISKHISFLKDFFKTYKPEFTSEQIDALEILLEKLYKKWNLNDNTDFSKIKCTDYPVMNDLYALCDVECINVSHNSSSLITEELLRKIMLGIRSMCIGAESHYFNGHTNIIDDMFVCYGVKGLLETNQQLKDAMLFNILSYMNHQLLVKGNTAAAIDELYLYLTNRTAIEYIRNIMKRDRKKDSIMLLASQNVEDFLQQNVVEFTKPLFSIPAHQFLFFPGTVNESDYVDTLQIEPSEYDLIRYPQRGSCLYRCGQERYLLQVHFPEFKSALFGRGGGR